MIKARIFCVPQELLSFQIYLDLVMDRHLGKSKDASNLKENGQTGQLGLNVEMESAKELELAWEKEIMSIVRENPDL